MADRSIREYGGKKVLKKHLLSYGDKDLIQVNDCVQVTDKIDLEKLERDNPWLLATKLVVKPDHLIKRRGNSNLLLLNATWAEVKAWIAERMNTIIDVEGISGELRIFIVEPFVPHEIKYEYYLAIRSVREGDEILFFRQGGVDVGDINAKAVHLLVKVDQNIDDFDLQRDLLKDVGEERRPAIAELIRAAFKLYLDAGFTYLELNPAAFVDGKMIPLDLAAKVDDTAEFACGKYWGELTFPAPFGRTFTEEERYIARLDSQSGASLKFTLLNPKGRIWTMVAGGGASVIYTDTIADLGCGEEVANYGEYSGNPNDEETYQYAKTILSLMTREADSQGREKILLIGGGIANFTDVAKTFRGIVRAIRENKEQLKAVNAIIYVRRGGPNYAEGLEMMRRLGNEIGIPIKIYGPETHMTKIVSRALAA